MTWLNSTFTIDDATDRGHAAWDLFLDNWGNEDAPSVDGTSLVFPALGSRALPAPAAIAIGPMSTVDRAIIRWNLAKIIPGNVAWDFFRRISVGAPLTFWQPANRGTVDAGSNAGSITVLSEGNTALQPTNENGVGDAFRFGTQYVKADGTVATFASEGVGFAPLWVAPLLHLVFYLQPPMQIPTKRHPYFFNGNVRVNVADTETLIAQIPVMGRQKAKVSFYSTTDSLSYRIGVLDNLPDNAAPFFGVEKTVFSAPGIAQNVPATADLDLAGNAAYLMLYLTGADNDLRTNIKVIATD